MKTLTTPISDEDISDLKVGDQISISGTIYTGRDAALPQLVELIRNDEVPFDLNGSVIMHTAVSNAGIAPTTSSKEEIESSIGPLSENGVKIHIGKGMLSEKTTEELKQNNSIFVITLPVAALLTSKVLEKECVLFEKEGMEAMFRLNVENIPGIVAIHNGNTIQPPSKKRQENDETLRLYSYIAASQYRVKIMKSLKDNFKIPKEMSQETGIHDHHVSKVLTELKGKEVIECLTENNRKGRIYRITPLGEKILEFLD